MLHARKDYQERIVDLAGKIPANEPVFFIRGNDMIGPEVVNIWANLAEEAGADPNIVAAARRQAFNMTQWQTDNNSAKIPDMPNEN